MYDVPGREVATPVNEEKLPGTCSATWDASGISSGMYFYRLVRTQQWRKCFWYGETQPTWREEKPWPLPAGVSLSMASVEPLKSAGTGPSHKGSFIFFMNAA